jgi:hypothetical protein
VREASSRGTQYETVGTPSNSINKDPSKNKDVSKINDVSKSRDASSSLFGSRGGSEGKDSSERHYYSLCHMKAYTDISWCIYCGMENDNTTIAGNTSNSGNVSNIIIVRNKDAGKCNDASKSKDIGIGNSRDNSRYIRNSRDTSNSLGRQIKEHLQQQQANNISSSF